MTTLPLPAKSLLGVLGGGQLGKMTIEAAHKLDYNTLVVAQSSDECAVPVATYSIVAPFDGIAVRNEFIAWTHAVTLESENIPPELVEHIAQHRRMCPSAAVLRIASDRIEEKKMLSSLGIPIGSYRVIRSLKDLKGSDFTGFTFPAILKRAKGGYDGRGQITVQTASNLRAAYRALGKVPCVLETKLNLMYEISVIVARNEAGETAVYPAIQNWHEDGILIRSQCPGPDVPWIIERDAQSHAIQIAHDRNLVGVIVVEMFVIRHGSVLVNEIAPRPHNSGHGTIEACVTSQFEQLVRVTAGLPLGSVELKSGWIMGNLIGVTYEEALALCPKGAKLYWYGKEPRPGRKVGHWTLLVPLS